MTNLYQDTAEPALPAPALEGDVRTDVVIVGAGFTGLSTALHLADTGAKVVVLDAEEPGWGASGRNGGQVNPGLKFEPDVVESDFGADLGGRMNALAGGAPQYVFDLIERYGILCDARQNGTLRAAARAGHAVGVRAAAEQWSRRRAPVELLSGSALSKATGTDRYVAALWDRRGGDLNPLSYARGLARAAMALGAAVHGGTRAVKLSRHGALWVVETRRGHVTAEQVVLATNGYTDDLWPDLRRSVVPVFGAITATAPLSPTLAESIMPCRAALYESGAITVYYRIDAAQRLLIGGRGPQREVSSAAPLSHLTTYALKLWPALRGIEWTHAWGGRLAMTRDHYPHLHELAAGVTACLGYNGRGVALSTAMGAVLAKRLLNPGSPIDMPVTGMKPIALHAAWPLAVRAAIARGRISDFLGT